MHASRDVPRFILAVVAVIIVASLGARGDGGHSLPHMSERVAPQDYIRIVTLVHGNKIIGGIGLTLPRRSRDRTGG